MAKNGKLSRIQIEDKKLQGVTDESFGLKTDNVDITTKDSVDWSEILPTRNNGTFNAEITFEKKPGGSPTTLYAVDLLNYQIAMTKVGIQFDFSTETGDISLTGDVYILQADVKASNNDKVTYSVQFQTTGALTVGTVS